MFPIVRSKVYPNIRFANNVSTEFRKNVEEVFEEFPYFHNKPILIVPVDGTENYDIFGSIFDSIGLLMYSKRYTSKLAAYAMFNHILVAGKQVRHFRDKFRHYSHIEMSIFHAMLVIPDKYIKNFKDIPGFERLGEVEPLNYQLRRMRDVIDKKFDDRLESPTVDNITIASKRNMPPCPVSTFFGKYNLTIKHIDEAILEKFPYINDAWDNILSECLTQRKLDGYDIMYRFTHYYRIAVNTDIEIKFNQRDVNGVTEITLRCYLNNRKKSKRRQSIVETPDYENEKLLDDYSLDLQASE